MSIIYIPTRRPDLIYPKSALGNKSICSICGKPYSWQIGRAMQFEKPDTEDEDNKTRAAALFAEYKRQGVGPCCAKPEHRTFISQHSGSVIYY